MPNIHAMHRKFERFLMRHENSSEPEMPMRKIADITYNHDKRDIQVKDIPLKNYLRIPSFGGEFVYNFKNKTEKFFEYKSRGKK